jgi:hypothetical protein
LREFIALVPHDVLSKLDKKVNVAIARRQGNIKLRRQATVAMSTPLISNSIPSHFRPINPRKLESSAIRRHIFDVSLRHESQDMFDCDVDVHSNDMDDDHEKTYAVKKIQNIARGKAARLIAEAKKTEIVNMKVTIALTQEDFLDVCGDFLRNTMYNLMEEALYDEFPVWADPLKFVIKK